MFSSRLSTLRKIFPACSLSLRSLFHIKSLPLHPRLLASCHADQTHARRHKPFYFFFRIPLCRSLAQVLLSGSVRTRRLTFGVGGAALGNLSKCDSDVGWNVNDVETSKAARRKMYILSSSPPPSSFSYIKKNGSSSYFPSLLLVLNAAHSAIHH